VKLLKKSDRERQATTRRVAKDKNSQCLLAAVPAGAVMAAAVAAGVRAFEDEGDSARRRMRNLPEPVPERT
jgi:hypothetical protein